MAHLPVERTRYVDVIRAAINFAQVSIRGKSMTQKLALNYAHKSGGAKARKTTGLRSDIQGLRAVAVLAVIADHTFAYPHGGFVGVDVFFVISGFLITGLLLREHERVGRISFADFYRKRARRILPLAVLVLVATVAASWTVFSGGRAMRVTEDGLWSLVFGTNWHLALIGTDYMQAGGAVSPLQHFWSLAVEEQFYVVWPWLIILVLGGAARAGWAHGRSRLVLTVAMIALTLAAFAFAMWETVTSPTVAYFSTFSRAWELGIGAILAASAGALAKLPQALRPALAYLGLAGIVWSIFAITPDMPFPAPWAAVPVLATALVIAAGTGGEVRYLAPLTNRVGRYVGDISYSLYLWHFPIIILFAAVLPLEGGGLFAVVLAATGLLSVLSYHLLEDPMRKSSWLEPRYSRALRDHGVSSSRPAIGGLVALALVTSMVVGAAVVREAGYRNAGPAAVPLASTGKAQAASTPDAKLTAQIDAALASPEWPELNPSVDSLGPKAKVPEWVTDGCLVGGESPSLEADIAKAETCVYGPATATKTAILIGDSVAISYVPGIRAALEPQGYRVMVLTMQQCPAVTVTVIRGDKSAHPRCDPFRSWALQKASELKPDLLILSSSEDASLRLASGATGSAVVMAEWATGTKATLQVSAGAAKRTVILDPPTGGKNLQDCATRISKPADCGSKPSQRYGELASATRQGIDQAAQPTVIAVSTQAWYCSANVCPAFVGTTPVYADTGHLTPGYSASLKDVMAAAFK